MYLVRPIMIWTIYPCSSLTLPLLIEGQEYRDVWMHGAEPSRNRKEPLTLSWLKVPVEMVSQVYHGEVNGLLGVCILR